MHTGTRQFDTETREVPHLKPQQKQVMEESVIVSFLDGAKDGGPKVKVGKR